MSKEKKTIIHEFDPCIYPRLLWVVKGGSLKELKDIFDLGDFENDENDGAMTFGTRRKEDKLFGSLIWFPKESNMNRGDWIAHEATHAALYIYNEIGATASFENQEPFAYLVGWIFECVDKVRRIKNGGKSKPKDNQDAIPKEACETKKEAYRNG